MDLRPLVPSNVKYAPSASQTARILIVEYGSTTLGPFQQRAIGAVVLKNDSPCGIGMSYNAAVRAVGGAVGAALCIHGKDCSALCVEFSKCRTATCAAADRHAIGGDGT